MQTPVSSKQPSSHCSTAAQPRTPGVTFEAQVPLKQKSDALLQSPSTWQCTHTSFDPLQTRPPEHEEEVQGAAMHPSLLQTSLPGQDCVHWTQSPARVSHVC
jgi:hypothetical protein